jgi:phosphoenolpyruvate carboxykinase (ATP)
VPQRHPHSKSFGVFSPSFGADKFGFHGLRSISYNLDAPVLYEEAIRHHEAVIAKGGALVADTGAHTGRSPKDKFIVADALTENAI